MLGKWDRLNLRDLQGRATELISDLRHAGLQANLNVPATPEKVAAFFQMFSCQRCGLCCRTQTKDGIALLSGEVERIAAYLKTEVNFFKKKYTIKKGRFIQHPCPFFEDGKTTSCQIYSARPQACILFPVNTPAKNETLYCNISCPAGTLVAEKILEYQAGVAASIDNHYRL